MLAKYILKIQILAASEIITIFLEDKTVLA